MPDAREISAWCAACRVVYAWTRNCGPRSIAEARCIECGRALERKPQVLRGRYEMSQRAPARAQEKEPA